jgi:tRNA(Ile)-lysidine synthase
VRSAESLFDDLLGRCTFPDAGTSVVCGLSGGADSSALVALAVHAGLLVTAVHVDHGLRPDAEVDAAAARRIADTLGADFRYERAAVQDGPNLEHRARIARRRLLGPDALTGHTADDQAETVLLALLRGSGATGLSGMDRSVLHPILRLRRADTLAVCAALDLDPVTDPTNSSPRFRRNRLRLEAIPLLDDIAERDVTPLLVRAADLLGDDDRFLDQLASELDPTDARAVAAAPRPLARRAIRAWLTVDGYPPDAASIERVLDVAAGRSAACEINGGGRITRTRQRLAHFRETD